MGEARIYPGMYIAAQFWIDFSVQIKVITEEICL
jgi:hypothetical protein